MSLRRALAASARCRLEGVDRGLGHFDVDDLGFDEPTAFQRVHIVQPLITEEQLVGCCSDSEATKKS